MYYLIIYHYLIIVYTLNIIIYNLLINLFKWVSLISFNLFIIFLYYNNVVCCDGQFICTDSQSVHCYHTHAHTHTHTHAHTEVRDNDNETPLHIACLFGHTEVVKFLVEEAKCNIGELIIL